MTSDTTQRVPGLNSRCRASHLSLYFIIPIHFTGLTLTVAYEKTVLISVLLPCTDIVDIISIIYFYNRGVDPTPLFFVDHFVHSSHKYLRNI